MNQSKIDALPEHLKKIKWELWHFYYNKKAKAGESKFAISDNFTDEAMRQANLHFIPEISKVVPIGEGQIYVEAKVIVYDEELWDLDEQKPTGRTTIGIASMTKMPHSDGQTHFAQVCITRALKTAVLRHLQISDHDILLVIDAYEFDPKTISQQTRTITDEVEEEATEAPIEPVVDLGLEV